MTTEEKKIGVDLSDYDLEMFVQQIGSYTKGTPRKHSDIDVAMVVEHIGYDHDFFKHKPWLLKLTRQVDDIEPIARDNIMCNK